MNKTIEEIYRLFNNEYTKEHGVYLDETIYLVDDSRQEKPLGKTTIRKELTNIINTEVQKKIEEALGGEHVTLVGQTENGFNVEVDFPLSIIKTYLQTKGSKTLEENK